MKQSSLLSLVGLAVWATAAPCQVPPPAPGPAPLMYVRFGAPPGMHVTFYQGKTLPRKFAAPVVVGLRPGYAYRVKLTDLPEHPGLALFPTLEVYGTLQLPPQLRG